jgi:hypothetical protein
MLLTERGRPRLVRWISSTASSQKRVPWRPAMVRWCLNYSDRRVQARFEGDLVVASDDNLVRLAPRPKLIPARDARLRRGVLRGRTSLSAARGTWVPSGRAAWAGWCTVVSDGAVQGGVLDRFRRCRRIARWDARLAFRWIAGGIQPEYTPFQDRVARVPPRAYLTLACRRRLCMRRGFDALRTARDRDGCRSAFGCRGPC